MDVHIPERGVFLGVKDRGWGWKSGQKETASGQKRPHLGNLYEKLAKVL